MNAKVSIQLRPGDIFLSKNPMTLGKVINFFQRIYATDNKSVYSHAGIITDTYGATLESLWRVESQNLFKAYKGEQVLVGRNRYMGVCLFEIGMHQIKNHIGDRYPFYRLLLHMIKPVAKWINPSKHLVCSELVGKFLWSIGLVDYYLGKNPDDIEAMIRLWRDWDVIFEGVI